MSGFSIMNKFQTISNDYGKGDDSSYPTGGAATTSTCCTTNESSLECSDSTLQKETKLNSPQYFDGLLLCGSICNTSREQQKRLEFIKQHKQHSDNFIGKSSIATTLSNDRLNYYKTLPFGEKIKKISCGSKHYLILTHSGRLFCSGWNDYGQLGIPKSMGQNYDLNASSATTSINYTTDSNSSSSGNIDMDVTNLHSPRVSSSQNQSNISLSQIQAELEPHPDLELNFLREIHLSHLLPLVESIGKPMLPMRRPSRTISRNLNLKIVYNVKLISCGDKHSMIVTQNGDVYSTGKNNDGQLGLGDFSNRFVYSKVNFHLNKDQCIDDIHCQFNNSAIITSKREVFVCGSNSNAQLGLFLHKTKISVFTQIPLFNIPIKSICFNIDTTAILSMDGEIFSCGIGGDMNDAASIVDPSTMPEEKRSTMYRKNTIIPFFKKVPLSERVDQLSSGIYFTLAISNSSKKIYIFHSHPNQNSSTTKNPFQDLCSTRPFSIDSHTTVVSSSSTGTTGGSSDSPTTTSNSRIARNEIYSVGSLSSIKPSISTNFNFKFISFGDDTSKNSFKSLVCGYHHSVFVNFLDQFFGCGKNGDGRLGFIDLESSTPNNEYQNYLKRVKFPIIVDKEWNFNSVACGESFTIFYNNENIIEGFNGGLNGTTTNTTSSTTTTTTDVLIQPHSTRVHTTAGDLFLFKPALDNPMMNHFLKLLSSSFDSIPIHCFDISHLQFVINAVINQDRFDSQFLKESSAKDVIKMLFIISICVPFGDLINLKKNLLECLFEKVNTVNVRHLSKFCDEMIHEMTGINSLLKFEEFNPEATNINLEKIRGIAHSPIRFLSIGKRFCNFYKKTIKEFHPDEKLEIKHKLPNLFKGTCRVYEMTMTNENAHTRESSHAKDLSKLFNSEEHSDVRVQLGKTTILFLHIDILTSFSETLRRELSSFHSSSGVVNNQTLDIVKLCYSGNEMSQGEKTLTNQALETALKLMYDVWTTDLSTIIEGTNYLEFIFKLLDLSRILQFQKLFVKSVGLIEGRRNLLNDDDMIELVERTEDFIEMWSSSTPENHQDVDKSIRPLSICVVKILSDKFAALKRRLRLKPKWKGLESLIYEFIEDEMYYC